MEGTSPDKFAFAKRSGAMKAPVGLLSDRTVLRSKMEGPRPDKFTLTRLDLKGDACTSSKELYEVYKMWCEENSLNVIKARGFSDALIANQRRYNLESTNNIVNSSGRRVRGFVGIEALVQPDLTLNSWRV